MSNEIMLGPFRIERNGMLSPSSMDQVPGFAVRWRGRVMRARIAHDKQLDPSSGTLNITSRIGRVPSSASANALPGVRQNALKIIGEFQKLVPDTWKLHLSADHTVVMEAQTNLIFPVSAISLVTTMASFLLALTPYLEVFDDEGLGVGKVNT